MAVFLLFPVGDFVKSGMQVENYSVNFKTCENYVEIMIKDVLQQIALKLEEYLRGCYDVPEEVVILGTPSGAAGEELMNRMVLSLLNIEREGAAGFAAAYSSGGSGEVMRRMPAWHLNLTFVVAAVFEDKRYAESLRLLSESIGFFQQCGTFDTGKRMKFTVEPVSLSIQELTNVWSILGGSYYPSVVYKLRMLTFDQEKAAATAVRISRT